VRKQWIIIVPKDDGEYIVTQTFATRKDAEAYARRRKFNGWRVEVAPPEVLAGIDSDYRKTN
jgi:hypothetical protein